jgi:2-polyprenyl-3-methyl-5-hydroxy-6-metoxy-1,4-benzoquinol methylase
MKPNLENSANFYSSKLGEINSKIVTGSCLKLNVKLLSEFNCDHSILVLGYGDGELLNGIIDRYKDVTLVEGSKNLVEVARNRFKNYAELTIINQYFEEFELEKDRKVNAILANHVLEHLDDPISLLRHSKSWLKHEGIALFTVPNASSLHRRIGAELNILTSMYDLSDQDKVVGHKRVYNIKQLREDLKSGGFDIISEGGFNLKLVSQKQMTEWSQDLHNAIYKISLHCPVDICSNLYTLCKIQT